MMRKIIKEKATKLFMEDLSESKLNISKIQEKENEALKEFIIMIWQPNPKREVVKVILDDGQVNFSVKYDRFYQIMFDTLTDLIKDSSIMDILTFIKDSLRTYGGIYYLNKANGEYRQLTNVPSLEHLRPLDIYNQTSSEMILEEKSKMDLFERSKINAGIQSSRVFGGQKILKGSRTYRKFYGNN